jgi:hypothetical protein
MRLASWYLKASSIGSRLKKEPAVGTRSFSLDLPGAALRSWSTDWVRWKREQGKRLTVVVDELLDIPEDLRVALMGVGRYGHEVLAVLLVDSGGLRVQHKRDRQKTLLNELRPVVMEWCTHFDPFDLRSISLYDEKHMKGRTYQLVSTMRLSE